MGVISWAQIGESLALSSMSITLKLANFVVLCEGKKSVYAGKRRTLQILGKCIPWPRPEMFYGLLPWP